MTLKKLMLTTLLVAHSVPAIGEEVASTRYALPFSKPDDFSLIILENGPQIRALPQAPRLQPGRIFLAPHKAKEDVHGRRRMFLPVVQAAEKIWGLPQGLLDALVWTESRYNPLARSTAGAVGLGQLMPGTARELGISNRHDPTINIHGSARYLRQMLDRFGQIHLALAAYNAGPSRVEAARGIPLNAETPGYVRSVFAAWKHLASRDSRQRSQGEQGGAAITSIGNSD